jgi:predicted Zn-dependent protease
MSTLRALVLACCAFAGATVIAVSEDEPRAASGILATANRPAQHGTRVRTRPRHPSYLGELLLHHDSVVMRWPERIAHPIAVWVREDAALPDWNPAVVNEVREALDEWEATGIPVRFTFIDDSASADVRITWVDRFREPVSGRTFWARDDAHYVTEGTIALARHHAWGAPLDLASVHALALHEIGHVLGLDHTSDADAIMAPRVRSRTLTAADIATVRALYALPAGPLH